MIHTNKQFDPSDQEARRNVIGSSDAPIITRTAPYQNQIHNTWKGLWEIKTKKSDAPDLSSNEAVQWGIDLEDTVRVRAKKQLGVELRKANETFYHRKYPFLACHPDSIIRGIKEIGEIKCPGMGTMMKMGENLENFLDSYKAQGIHQLLVMDKMKAVQFFVQYPQKRLKVYRMERDDRAIDNYLQLALAFWELVEKDIPPEPQTEVETNDAYFNHKPEFMPFNHTVAEKVRRVMDIEIAEDKIAKEKKELRLEIKKAIGNFAGMKWDYSNDDVQLQRYKRPTFNEDSFFESEPQETIDLYSVNSIDKALLRKENRELYDKHSDQKQITRLILPKL
tara:strand:- start:1963 stop:2970 length:1008 start_codon:yes stop_codon:yes gene_type:complete